MTPDRKSQEESLLDWHLDRVDDEERSRIEVEVRSDTQMQAKSDRLRRLLEPLDRFEIEPCPPDLADKTLAFVERSAAGQRRRESSKEPVLVSGDSYSPWRFPRFRNFAAVAACILLLLGVLFPGLSELRDRSRRVVCANNLGSICRGTSLYQQAFAGSLPYAGTIRNASWLPGAGANKPYASNSRHPFLLLKLRFGPQPSDFVCPSSPGAAPMKMADVGSATDFKLARNICYDTMTLGGAKPNLRPRGAIAYAGDRNPLFIGAKFNAKIDPDKTNSPHHRGRGQTVLTLDGCATWITTPIHGPKRDNVWLIRNIRRYTGMEAPTRNDDAFLIPGFPVTDPAFRDTLRR